MDKVIILLAVVISVAGGRPPVMPDDSLNEVKWSSHDYEVHDREADQSDQRDDREEYYTIIVPVIVENGQDQQPSNQGNNQVSVEVNGDYGLVEHSLEKTTPISYVKEEELLYNGDFDKRQRNPEVIGSKEIHRVAKLDNEDTPFGLVKSHEETGIKSMLDDASSGNEHKHGLQSSDVSFKPPGEPITSSDIVGGVVDRSVMVNYENSSDELESSKSILEDKLEELDETHSEKGLKSDTVRYSTKNENTHIPNNSWVEEDPSSNISKNVDLQEKEEQLPSSSTVANTPLINVRLLEDDSSNKKMGKDSTSSPNPSAGKVKSFRNSPITRIIKVSSRPNPPKLVKDVLPVNVVRRRVLVEVKKRDPHIQESDTAVSSTVDSLTVEDYVDDAEYNEEEDDDIPENQQDRVLGGPRIPAQPVNEAPVLHNPVLIDRLPLIPVPFPYPELPSKVHQPVLHHIIHALFSPPSPEDGQYPDDAFPQRYSPNFVPEPDYLAIPI